MKKLFLFLIVLFFIGNVIAANCMTLSQVQAERTNCLFIYNNDVYKKGSYGNSHHGHSCGSDVTSVMESSHVSNPSHYLTPYYYADICASCVPSTEICDAIDNDCDGQIDEGLSRSQSCGTGACQRTITQTCSGGNWGPSCIAGQATSEICNGIDDNCDGTIDNSVTDSWLNQQTICGVGECSRTGSFICQNGQKQNNCAPGNPSQEVCDSKDNNCDGQIDEGCSCQNGQIQECGSNIGECKKGNQTCSNGAWGGCIGGISSVAEICNEKDDDCNGQVDDGLSNCLNSTNCSSLWNCEGWSDCINGIKTRVCNDINNCSIKTNYADTTVNCTIIQNQSNNTQNVTNVSSSGNNNSVSQNSVINNLSINNTRNSINNKTTNLSKKINSIKQNNLSISSLTALVSAETMWMMGRITGMLAFLFLALSIFGAVYKLKHHKLISYNAIILVIIHLIVLMNDGYTWGKSLTIFNSLFPNFENITQIYISLGIIAFYLMLLGILGCIFFKGLVRKLGFKKWIWIHRLALPAFILVYIHALKIGTDFSNIWYQMPFILIFILIFGKYIFRIFKGTLHPEEQVQTTVNTNEFWFKYRASIFNKNKPGIGFIPFKWEGWVTYLVFFVLIIFFAGYSDIWNFTIAKLIYFLISLIILFFIFIIVSKIITEENIRSKKDKNLL